jgi:uncharacterized damage-inducible protein DinB
MGAEHRLAQAAFEEAHRTFTDNVRGISLDEALDAGGGFRSILGLIKHTVGWSAVYHSFAFDDAPRTWEQIEWPRGLRDQIEPTEAYLHEILEWSVLTQERWLASTQPPADLDLERPLPWGRSVPLREIIAMMAGHEIYHAGEINMILAMRRGEAWEAGEQVEENHIDTTGHVVDPNG